MTGIRIAGTGRYVPPLTADNNDFAAFLDTNDEGIRSRTGIVTRHISDGEPSWHMGLEASRQALEAAGIAPEQLGLIIDTTITPDYSTPATACVIQRELGAVNAMAFDVNSACTGFVCGLDMAARYLATDPALSYVLVVSNENLSRVVDYTDRSSCILFGDGAGAAVVTDEGDAFKGFVQGSDGKGGEALDGDNRPVVNPFTDNGKQSALGGYVTMDGPAVYKFAVKTVPKAINELLDEIGWSADDVDVYVLHQANIRIIESVAKRLKQPMDKFPTNLQQCGNISAASVPILLDKVRKDGMIKHEEKIILSGFGAGLTWGACAIEWQ